MKTRGIVATPKQQSSDYIYDDPNPSPSLSSKPSSPSSHLGPLVQCPECPKSFAQLRSLYGHFGRSHSGMKLYQDLILYGCPYCQLEDVEFMTLDDVAAHVEGYHEGLELLIEKTAKGMAGYSSGGSLKCAAATAAADNQGSKVASAHYNLSEDIEVEENNESSSSPKQSKLTSHPLAKCPNCPKVLLLRGIFGHFGRVHSSIKFDWSKVTYLCPFCDADGKECGMYTTFEETQAHVEEEHEGCALVPITPSTRGNSNSEVDVSEKEASPPVLRMSQRKRTSVSMAVEAEQQPQPTLPPSNKRGIQTTLYQCPSCERSFNKQGLATHYGMVHSKTLDWNKVQTAQNETRTYICPECERTFSKGGLTTHFGMMHDGRLDWTKVKIIGGGEGGITLKRKRETDVESSDEEEGEGGEDEEGPVRKSRRISARAMSRSAYEEDGDFVTYDSAASAGGGSVSSNNAPALNFGPWTPDEHEAFLIGHRKHGNSWSLISQHFVPTRTAKQIGSHALAYFTTQGQWEGRNGPRKSTGEEDRPANHKDVTSHELMVQPKAKEKRRKSAAVDTSEDQIRRSAWSDEEHAAFIEGHKKLGNAWMLISKLYVPSRTPKQVGSHALHHFTAIGKWEEAKKSKRDPSIYENINNMDESSSNGQSDDGNFDYCIVCEDGGVLICCSDCPRSYHRSCIDNNTSTLPLTWTCERCQTDYDVLPHEEIPTDAASADIQSTYSKFVYSEGFEKCCELLTKLSFIVAQLKDADHGYIFAEPVDLQIVPQYTLKVDTPMDYSTILSKINKGTYATNLKSHDMKRPMEAIVLHVMYDVELVHKNCSTFNPKGSSVYRAGISQSKKWSAYFKKYLLPSLPSTVSWAYQNGLSDTEQTEQQEGIQCKQPKSPKKSKRVDASSSGVILTKEQIDSFETIYFSSAADLTEPIGASSEASRVVTQWFERLEDLRKHKVLHGTGIVTTGLDDKLYQWIIRQRKRFHLTLHYNPQFRSERYAQMLPSDSSNEREEDVAWLMKSPPMTGTFALLSPPRAKKKVQSVTPAPKEREEDVKAIARDIKTSKVIQDMHQKTLYFPVNSSPPYRHSSSLFWDESLEALRFFHGEYKHTIVPRSYPHDELLSLWVETQRAKLLLNLVGLDSGLLGAQVHVLDDEIHLCEVFAAGNAVSNQSHHSVEDAVEDFDDMHEDVDQNNTTEEATPPPVQSIDIPVEASPIEVQSADKSSELEMGANEEANATGEKGEEDKAQVEGGVVQESVPSAAEPEGDGAEDEKEREDDASPIPPESETSEKDSDKETRVPLCKCPACEKSFDTLRKLYGHFGSAHARIKGLKIATNEVFFECPWCKDGVFKPLEEIEAHVKESHGKNCQLSKSEYKSSSAPKKEKVIRPKAKPKLQPTVTPTAPKKVSPFKIHLNEFIAWYKQHPFPILETMNKELYLWCWKQCNGAAALLSGSPNVSNTKLNMNATKLKLLASNGFFRVFSYTDKAMVYEDDYEGSDDWDAAFNSVETFSINHGSTHIPDYIHVISGDKRAWISEVHDELRRFVKGEHCELSTRQIEQLILIGFCTDRSDLPNLTRSDVIWLKRFRELKQYQLVFGDCHVTEDFLELHQWVTEQRKLFRLFRMGNDALLKIERLQMLMDAGVDFFTSDYFPFLTQDDIMKFETQISTPPDLFHGSSLPHVINDDFSEDDYSSKLDSMKAANGHSLVLADEHLDVYQWHIAMRSALLNSYAARHEAGSPNSPLRHLVLNCVKDNDSAAPDDKFFKSKESLVLWSKYCERFMMFLAVKGHGHIPKDYPDIALVQWLSKQQDDLYHCSKHPNNTELPMHLKLLTSLGVQAKKRHVQPIFSTRILRRKSPIKSKTKKLIVA